MPKRLSTSVKVFYPKFDSHQVIKLIKKEIEPLNRLLPLKLMALFGSYAQGNYTVASDVDLLVIYQGKTRPDAYNLIRKSLSLPRLEPHVYSEEEYKSHNKVIDQMLKKAKIIYPG